MLILTFISQHSCAYIQLHRAAYAVDSCSCLKILPFEYNHFKKFFSLFCAVLLIVVFFGRLGLVIIVYDVSPTFVEFLLELCQKDNECYFLLFQDEIRAPVFDC